jgi:hypothetical protein
METDVTIEIDTDEIWSHIEDNVQECAERMARDTLDDWDFSSYIDYADGAESLLRDYHPGTSCRLGQLFEDKVQAAVTADDFLAEAIKEAVGTTDGVPAVDPVELRNIVREEIRDALAAARHAIHPAPIV